MACGGPINMASNVQQNKPPQCIRRTTSPRENVAATATAAATITSTASKPAAAAAASSLSASLLATAETLSFFKKAARTNARTPTLFAFFGSTANNLLLKLLILLSVVGSKNVVLAEGNVGCQFVRTLCLERSEVCFDDKIFGKCIPRTGVDVEDIERTPLSEEQSRILSTMLEEMQGAGLGWDHPYVQCRIQGTLYTLRKQTQLPPNLCANLAPNPTNFDIASGLAVVRFNPPSLEQQQAFYPPLKKQLPNSRMLGGGGGNGDDAANNGINALFHKLQMQDRQLRHDPLELAHFGRLDNQNEAQMEAATVTDNLMTAFLKAERARIERQQQQQQAEYDAQRNNAVRNQLELYQILAASEPDPQPYQRSMPNEDVVLSKQSALVPDEETNDSNELYFPENYGTLKRTNAQEGSHSFFRERQEQQAAAEDEADAEANANADLQEQKRMPVLGRSVSANEAENSQLQSNDLEPELQLQLEYLQNLRRNSLKPFEEQAVLESNTNSQRKAAGRVPERIFTEGGMLYMTELDQDNDNSMDAALLADAFGFTRHERLDVKKPGPQVSRADDKSKQKSNKTDVNKENLPKHIRGNDADEQNKMKKQIEQHSADDHANHTVDAEYAYVEVKNPIDSWNDGVRIVNELSTILHMQGYFTYLTVKPHEVSFRVDSNNPERRNASEIARAINDNQGVKNNLLRRLGVTVLRAGVGNKIKSAEDQDVTRIELADNKPDVPHILSYLFAGAGVAAVIVIFVTLILIKRHDTTRGKLGGLQSGVVGVESCSKDYQDLCRARMAGKGNASDAANTGVRVTALGKDNERAPSSRSSTSSWCEEPAMTNMDISTGHMVLSYMEDHLRNKGRLQREWEALCRYEAEPSAREAAMQPQCANLNRPGAPLPYDHSRVVLNHLANAEGLDYVNASTITDHDPRTPAYVAAQGPLPTTLSHFWQMIWEQGAVVIVALCRLQENGDIACARYWPEEGAEVYHIYEVHLVSEHIWCDDYLVRSFYLKNLRTSETRTVTQFHFLSWPQAGIPNQAKALLDFRRKVNKSYRGRSCPIVVHGSTGAGRTGAYILLDLVLGRMSKGAREIDIAATLEHLRDQRSGLVATRQQFEFVLMAVAEEVHAILKALPANSSGEKRELDINRETHSTSGVLKEEAESEAEESPSTSKTIKEADSKTAEKDNDKDKAKNKDKSSTNEKDKSTPSKKNGKKK